MDGRLLGLLSGLSRPSAVYASCSIRSRHSLNGSSGTSPELDLFPAFPPFSVTSAMQSYNQNIRIKPLVLTIENWPTTLMIIINHTFGCNHNIINHIRNHDYSDSITHDYKQKHSASCDYK